jgi:carbamate kinase
MAKIVIALGGNALGNDAYEQIEKAKTAACAVVDLIQAGHEVLIGHGNGPQVGMIKKAFDEEQKQNDAPGMPFAECTAMSQGYIGYHLSAAIEAELNTREINNKPVVALVTRVVVDESDKAFAKPTKPVGGYYNEAAARKLMAETGHVYSEDAGRGWRRMVASPMPVDIMEKSTVTCLLENGRVVIACGGGGIPVAQAGNELIGQAAVIDKDFAAAKLAEILEADYFIILTAVENVALNFGKPNQLLLERITVAQAEGYIKEGHFAKGSMLPKVEAAVSFAKSGSNRHALITLLQKAKDGIEGKTGTVVSLS